METALVRIEPGGTGNATLVHEVPFHWAAKSPTVRQSLADRHETSKSVDPPDCFPDGVGVIVHDLPFHTSPRDTKASFGLRESPTALQKVFETQDTPIKALELRPFGLGGRCIAHDLPFQISDNKGWEEEPAS